LQPYEEISLLNLSGGFPVKEGNMKALSLELGPAQMKD